MTVNKLRVLVHVLIQVAAQSAVVILFQDLHHISPQMVFAAVVAVLGVVGGALDNKTITDTPSAQ